MLDKENEKHVTAKFAKDAKEQLTIGFAMLSCSNELVFLCELRVLCG